MSFSLSTSGCLNVLLLFEYAAMSLRTSRSIWMQTTLRTWKRFLDGGVFGGLKFKFHSNNGRHWTELINWQSKQRSNALALLACFLKPLSSSFRFFQTFSRSSFRSMKIADYLDWLRVLRSDPLHRLLREYYTYSKYNPSIGKRNITI